MIPEEDIARQAVASLRGYAYQIWASALAWTELKGSEVLLLEVAEDFSLLSAEALALKQSKDTAESGSATLRTEGVVDAINAFWRYRKANPALAVSLVYLTTSVVGKEQKVKFPDGERGLTYWRTAARDDGDVEPLTDFLRDLASLDGELKAWLGTASAGDVREQLLRPIRWECGQPPLTELDALLDEALVLLCDTKGLLPAAARLVRDVVLVDLLRVTANADQDARRRTRAQLLELVQRVVTASAPTAALIQQHATGAAPPVLEPLMPTLGPRAVERPSATSDLKMALSLGTAWLHGASGTGKTGLSASLAGTSNRQWCSLDLRDLTAATAAQRLRSARREILARDDVAGVVIDDFPVGDTASLRRELVLLRSLAARRDAGLLVVSYKPPPPSLAADLDLADGALIEAPYFSEDETGKLIAQSGGDPTVWARSTHVFCGDGHPQLVAARVAGLRSRNWPTADLMEVLEPGGPKDIEAEREAVRLRLYNELPSDVRGMLYRVSVVSGAFDRRLAVAIGATPPPIAEPGTALDLLTGAWLEPMPRNRLRVSPLVANAGAKALAPDVITEIHRAIAEELCGRSPFDASQLGQLLFSALLSKHHKGLTIIVQAALDSKHDGKIVANFLFALPLLRSDTALVDFDPSLNRMLRLAQLKVASYGDDVPRLLAIYRRLLEEIGSEEDVTTFRRYAAWHLLMTDAPLPAGEWFAPLAEIEAPLTSLEATSFAQTGQAIPWGRDDIPQGAVAFAMRAGKLQNIDQLAELFAALEEIGEARRKSYLHMPEAIAATVSLRTIIQMAWVRASSGPGFDGAAAAARYVALEEQALAWGEDDLALECRCSRAVLLAEYVGQNDQALAVLEEGERVWPSHPRLLRERAKILFAQNRFEEVFANRANLLKGAEGADAMDRAHLVREIALSAGQIGVLSQAVELFAEAEKATEGEESLAEMAVGLMGDRAFLTWRTGARVEAIATVRDALLAAEKMDVQSKRGQYVVRALSVVIRAMYQDMTEPGWDAAYPSVYGIASRPPANWTEKPAPTLLSSWYQLASVDKQVGSGAGVSELLLERKAAGRIATFELIAIQTDFIDVFQGNAPAQLVAGLSEFARVFEYTMTAARNLGDGPDPGLFDALAAMPWDGSFDPSNTTQREAAESAILTSAAFACGRGQIDWIAQLKAAAAGMERLDPQIAVLVADLPEPGALYDHVRQLHVVLWAFDVLLAATPAGQDLCVATLRTFEWLGKTVRPDLSAAALAPRLIDRWRWVVEHSRFSMRLPNIYGPAILATLDHLKDRSGIARLCLAAIDAFSINLPETFKAALRSSGTVAPGEG